MKQEQIEFTYMRAIAIMWIVAGHSIYQSGHGFPPLLENVVKGGTALFVYISGYFYHKIFFPRLKFVDFMGTKIRNVLVPFLWVSLVGLIWLAVRSTRAGALPVEVAQKLFVTIGHGFVYYPHWYIPFIMIVFACSPLFSAYIRLDSMLRLLVFVLMTLVALLMHRPVENINVLQSVIYFAPFYLLGILFSAHEEWLLGHAAFVFWAALLGFVASLATQTWIDPHLGNYHKAALTWGGVDWQLVQKLSLCALVLAGCQYLARQRMPARAQTGLTNVARMSFAIFFVHVLVLDVFLGVANRLHILPMVEMSSAWVSFSLLTFVCVMAGSLLIAWSVKAWLGDRSRSYIGW